MIIQFSKEGWEDYLYWQEVDKTTLSKINRQIKEIARHPFQGTGKPEPLKAPLRGWWSRRITAEHRLVYRVSGDENNRLIEIVQCRYHY